MEHAQAPKSAKSNFLYHHAIDEEPCDEWRFQGMLGYGGKYFRQKNRVDCNVGDDTPAVKAVITTLNDALAQIPQP
jgi:hypothetical protein